MHFSVYDVFYSNKVPTSTPHHQHISSNQHISSKHHTTPSAHQFQPPHHTTPTHHIHAGLQLKTLLHKASLGTDYIILTPKILIITQFNLYLY